jgi:hypothetical protein
VRSVTLRLLLWAALLVASLAVPAIGTAQEAPNRAGLIVIHDDGRVSWSLVEFAEDAISGVDLLHRSGFEVTEVNFGALGVGVCSIDATGCEVSQCRQRVCQGPRPDDPYWQYFLANPDGSWTYASLGVSSDTVLPGDVRAFAWTAETPGLAAPTIEEVAARALDRHGDRSWLTRYAADGSVLHDDPTEDSGNSGGVLVVAAAVALVGLVALRTRLFGLRR